MDPIRGHGSTEPRGAPIPAEAVAPGDQYPEIGEYAYLSDCHSAALVSRAGGIDWACMPRIDSPAVFSRLLDWARGGTCLLGPVDEATAIERRYLDGTMVLQTDFHTRRGTVRLTDAIAMRKGGARRPLRQILRRIECVAGEVEVQARVAARFDFGVIAPLVRQHAPTVFTALGGASGLIVTSDVPLAIDGRHDLAGTILLRAGEAVRLSLEFRRPEELDPAPDDVCDPTTIDGRLDDTIAWWREWLAAANVPAGLDPAMQRSGLVLKALTNAPTGAIAAAATTSLPEKIGGERNWDYRFSWIRDSWLTVRCLASMGHTAEAEGFRRFIERSVAGSARDLQLMYGVGGERVLPERELTELGGYRGSRPVRVGNLASQQLQLDMYGYLVELAWVWAEREHEPDEDYWSFIVDLLDIVGDAWTQPDHGIWEMRDEPRHFVHSKVMCWVAFDRGLKLARVLGHRDGTRRWERHRNHIRRLVLAQGTSPARGCFVQSFGSEDVDASLLVLPVVGFVRYDDPRMAATADAVIADLVVDGLVRRYRTPDGLRGDEGTFIACTFWLVECLVGLNRFAEASHYFDRARATANDLGLFSEQYDTEAERALGNYPQALSHLAHIGAALALRHGPR